MCWNPCKKITDVEVRIPNPFSFVTRPEPGTGASFSPTQAQVKQAIKDGIAGSGCEQKCPCEVDDDEPKKLHKRKGKKFNVHIAVAGKGSVDVDGECDLTYNTQDGICEPDILVASIGLIPEFDVTLAVPSHRTIPPEILLALAGALSEPIG
jgi:hypothetical protein